METRCSQCKRIKNNYSIKPSTGLNYKTCDDCRKHMTREVEVTPFQSKRFLNVGSHESGTATCGRCKEEKPDIEFKQMKYGGLTKSCIKCLAVEKVYRDSYALTGSTKPKVKGLQPL